MELIVWNSQGGKWDYLWDDFVTPVVTTVNDDVLAFTVEAGWAPWMASGDVNLGAVYYMDDARENFDERAATKSSFCWGITADKGRKALWIPWVRNYDALKTNSRCSLGGAIVARSGMTAETSTINDNNFIRPVVRTILKRNYMVYFTILSVHLESGNGYAAQIEMDYLIAAMTKLIPQGTSAIVVGDMNVNLLTNHVVVPQNWTILNTGVATQQSGGELDYGLLYNPTGFIRNPAVQVVQQYKTPPNMSDHSVLRYTLPERR